MRAVPGALSPRSWRRRRHRRRRRPVVKLWRTPQGLSLLKVETARLQFVDEAPATFKNALRHDARGDGGGSGKRQARGGAKQRDCGLTLCAQLRPRARALAASARVPCGAGGIGQHRTRVGGRWEVREEGETQMWVSCASGIGAEDTGGVCVSRAARAVAATARRWSDAPPLSPLPASAAGKKRRLRPSGDWGEEGAKGRSQS